MNDLLITARRESPAMHDARVGHSARFRAEYQLLFSRAATTQMVRTMMRERERENVVIGHVFRQMIPI